MERKRGLGHEGARLLKVDGVVCTSCSCSCFINKGMGTCRLVGTRKT
jgi:methylthioribose-1-phosphate isomerase